MKLWSKIPDETDPLCCPLYLLGWPQRRAELEEALEHEGQAKSLSWASDDRALLQVELNLALAAHAANMRAAHAEDLHFHELIYTNLTQLRPGGLAGNDVGRKGRGMLKPQ